MVRKPHSNITLENDNNFGTSIKIMERFNSCLNSKTLKKDSNPWSRLYEAQTLNSFRKSVGYYDPLVPQDDLDFVIKSKYNHHDSLWADRSKTLVQIETLSNNHGRILKNRKKKVDPDEVRKMYVSTFKERLILPKIDGSSIKNAIESHHSPQTNPGFSRKVDGGFYTT